MATPSSVAKRAAKQTATILVAIKELTAEVATMKVQLLQPEIVELEAPADRTGEILAANGQAFASAEDLSRRILEAVALVAAEMAALKSEVAGLKTIEMGKQLERIIDVVETIDAEMMALRSEIGIVRRMQETQNSAQVQAKRKAKK